ncbi:MAG: hypothetical protein KQI35_05390 [Bacteroidetes bacterium]|nr:hypothetical protein [Bacteroidota bacterium]
MMIHLFIGLSWIPFFTIPVNGQQHEKNSMQEILDHANLLYGPDDFLERGLVYIPANPKASGHPFLTEQDWNIADITMLGNTFRNVEIKYNIEQDILILKKHIQGSDVNLPILLNSAQIDEFQMDARTFSNLSQYDSTFSLMGFGEILFNGKFLAYRKYSKIFRNQYSRNNPFGFYTKLSNGIFIHWNGRSNRIINNRSLKNTFEPIRTPLKKKMRQMHFQFKKATENEFFELLKWCDAELSENRD